MKKIEVIFEHIKEDCIDIQTFIKNVSKEEFMINKLLKKAVCMSLINIGELVKALPQDFCDNYPQLPWKRIAGMRDITAHKYKTLDMNAVWEVAVGRIPEIIQFIDYELEK
jgi:uncharacterized protein with HEPN domain